MNNKSIMPTLDLAHKLIVEQFPEYSHLQITDVEKQGHDNRTYRLGEHMLIRMPTAADYALKVPKEQELLPQLAKHLSVSIPAPIYQKWIWTQIHGSAPAPGHCGKRPFNCAKLQIKTVLRLGYKNELLKRL